MLDERLRATLFNFLNTLQKLLAEYVTCEYLDELEKEMNKSLALLERDFPIAIQVRIVLVHIYNA